MSHIILSEDLTKVYLVIYNLCQFVGFIYVLAVMGIRYSRDGPGTFTSIFLKYFHSFGRRETKFRNFIGTLLARVLCMH